VGWIPRPTAKYSIASSVRSGGGRRFGPKGRDAARPFLSEPRSGSVRRARYAPAGRRPKAGCSAEGAEASGIKPEGSRPRSGLDAQHAEPGPEGRRPCHPMKHQVGNKCANQDWCDSKPSVKRAAAPGSGSLPAMEARPAGLGRRRRRRGCVRQPGALTRRRRAKRRRARVGEFAGDGGPARRAGTTTPTSRVRPAAGSVDPASAREAPPRPGRGVCR